MSRELLARAWQAGAGPGDGPLTIDLDSTICETYGSRLYRQAGLCFHRPGNWPLREGRANRRGAAHFLRETVGRVRC